MAQKKTLVASHMSTQSTPYRRSVYAGLIFQFASLPELAPSHYQNGGCRSVVGPVPQLLWIRSCNYGVFKVLEQNNITPAAKMQDVCLVFSGQL